MNPLLDFISSQFLDFISSQYRGILAGILLAIILVWGKKIINYFKNIANNRYKRKMEKNITESIQLANMEMGISLFPKVKLKIVNHKVSPEELENEIVIYIKKENKAFVHSNIIAQVLDTSFLRDSKRHIHPFVYDSTKHMTGKSIITHDMPLDYLDKFKREALRYYERKLDDLFLEDQFLTLIKKEELIIIKGMFKQILLQELYALGERMIGKFPSDQCQQESIELVDFLYNNARQDDYQREEGVLPPLDFNGVFFKLGLILVKKPEKSDLTNHFKSVRIIIKNRALSIYILGLGENTERIKGEFVDWLNLIATKNFNNEWYVEKTLERKIPKFQNKEENIPGICCVFRHKSWIP